MAVVCGHKQGLELAGSVIINDGPLAGPGQEVTGGTLFWSKSWAMEQSDVSGSSCSSLDTSGEDHNAMWSRCQGGSRIHGSQQCRSAWGRPVVRKAAAAAAAAKQSWLAALISRSQRGWEGGLREVGHGGQKRLISLWVLFLKKHHARQKLHNQWDVLTWRGRNTLIHCLIWPSRTKQVYLKPGQLHLACCVRMVKKYSNCFKCIGPGN